jgi:hypothetical protein
MIQEIKNTIDLFEVKTSWGTKEIKVKLEQLAQKLETSINENSLIVTQGCSKLIKVDEVKPHDILYVSVLGGVPHYLLVHKIVDDKVFCLMLTSTVKDYLLLHQVKNDRMFKNNYITNTYFSISLAEAKKSFTRVFEDKKESALAFKKLIAYYKKLF